jgi:uncharacterized membrane protein
MSSIALLFTLAAIGIAETRYLLHKRLAEEHPVCPIGGRCELVLNSDYNKTFGIHNDLLGLGFYVFTLVSTAVGFLDIGTREFHQTLVFVMLYALLGASAMSLYFVYLQSVVIRAWCTWCLLSTTTIFLMLLISLS